jgi:hypothetical protein
MALSVTQSAGSCVVFEVSRLETEPAPEVAVRNILNMLPDKAKFVLFSGVTKNAGFYHAQNTTDYGTGLAEFIAQHALGKVTASGEQISWTKNTVRCWLWEPDKDAIKRWKEQHGYPISGAAGNGNNPQPTPAAGAGQDPAVPVGDLRRIVPGGAAAGAGPAGDPGTEEARIADFIARRQRGDWRRTDGIAGVLIWASDRRPAPNPHEVNEWRRRGLVGRF